VASGRPWSVYLRDWTERERLHAADRLLRLLDERFERDHLEHGAYFFPDLVQTSAEDELAAIEAGRFERRASTMSGGCARGTALDGDDLVAWGAETRSSCRGEFVFVDEAAEQVAAVHLKRLRSRLWLER
jgi:hypothetical protein